MSKTTLIIARHGNTFGPGDTPTRVGARTDLDLVYSGLEQGRMIGQYLKNNDMVPDVVFSGALKRAYQTAEQACDEMGLSTDDITVQELFNEIDYGPDENKTEDEVVARIGQNAIDEWNKSATVPDGWAVDPEAIKSTWQEFGALCNNKHNGKIILVVTSNGIARFAPYLTGDFDAFTQEHKIKISTGALCFLSKNSDDKYWSCDGWNLKPKNHL